MVTGEWSAGGGVCSSFWATSSCCFVPATGGSNPERAAGREHRPTVLSEPCAMLRLPARPSRWMAQSHFLSEASLVLSLEVSCCRSVPQSSLTLCDPVDRSTPGLPVLHRLLERAQTQARRVGDAIRPCHPLLSPSPPAFSLPSIRVFARELALHIRWPQCWNFSLSCPLAAPYVPASGSLPACG